MLHITDIHIQTQWHVIFQYLKR